VLEAKIVDRRQFFRREHYLQALTTHVGPESPKLRSLSSLLNV
jgi:hypothetical protein